MTQANEALQEAKEKAEESNKLKTEFLNNMSHEIRTPMNGILGFAEILKLPDLSLEKQKNYINIIQNSGDQLLRVIDDIIEKSHKDFFPVIPELCSMLSKILMDQCPEVKNKISESLCDISWCL